jgi:hypothetical protein
MMRLRIGKFCGAAKPEREFGNQRGNQRASQSDDLFRQPRVLSSDKARRRPYRTPLRSCLWRRSQRGARPYSRHAPAALNNQATGRETTARPCRNHKVSGGVCQRPQCRVGRAHQTPRARSESTADRKFVSGAADTPDRRARPAEHPPRRLWHLLLTQLHCSTSADGLGRHGEQARVFKFGQRGAKDYGDAGEVFHQPARPGRSQARSQRRGLPCNVCSWTARSTTAIDVDTGASIFRSTVACTHRQG